MLEIRSSLTHIIRKVPVLRMLSHPPDQKYKEENGEENCTSTIRAPKLQHKFFPEAVGLKQLIIDEAGDAGDRSPHCLSRNVFFSATPSDEEETEVLYNFDVERACVGSYGGRHRKIVLFPPPIPALARTPGLRSYTPWKLARVYASDGRLVIRKVRAKRQDYYFRTSRENGRLRMQLVSAVIHPSSSFSSSSSFLPSSPTSSEFSWNNTEGGSSADEEVHRTGKETETKAVEIPQRKVQRDIIMEDDITKSPGCSTSPVMAFSPSRSQLAFPELYTNIGCHAHPSTSPFHSAASSMTTPIQI